MSRWRRRFGRLVASGAARPAWLRYGIAVMLPVIAMAITGSVFSVGRSPFFSLFSLSVVLASVCGGRNSGLATTAFSALLNILAVAPRFSLRVNDPENLSRVLVFAIVGTTISVLIGMVGDLQRVLDVERERLQITLASIGDCVIATDANGRITFINRVAEEATGWTSAEAGGRRLEEVFRIVNERTREAVSNPVRKVIDTGRIAGLANHTVLVRRDGREISIDDSAAPIRDPQGNIAGVVLVFRDVTHERQAQAALIRTEKLASVGQLAASIAHEINNPLAAISNLLYLIENGVDVGDASRTLARTAQRELNRAAYVTKHTLSFARRSDKRRSVQLSDLVDEVLGLYANRVSGISVEVVKRFQPQAFTQGSSSEVRQVIANLISNALDASKPGARLHLRIATSTWLGNPRVRLTVADTGSGVSPEHLPRLFEPFFSTKHDTGTGLGLWVTKEIVDGHGGCVHVRSRVGKGTVVIVCWPAAAVFAERETTAV